MNGKPDSSMRRGGSRRGAGPKLLLTGFGPFPGALENPTEALIRALADEPPGAFGAHAMTAIVLPTEYRRSWEMLRRIFERHEPDVVVHFGLNSRAKAIHVETVARNRINPARVDAAGRVPLSARARRFGPETLTATYPAEAIVKALMQAGLPAGLSDDAGGYVCNATLYRSLHAAPNGRRIGFIHVPPARVLPAARLWEAATIILRTATVSG